MNFISNCNSSTLGLLMPNKYQNGTTHGERKWYSLVTVILDANENLSNVVCENST